MDGTGHATVVPLRSRRQDATAEPATVVFAEIRGWARVADRVGAAGLPPLWKARDLATQALWARGASEIESRGEHGQPALVATFEGPDHAARATRAAIDVRAVVSTVGVPGLPGFSFSACVGIDAGPAADFAERLAGFAGPGQIFLSVDALAIAGLGIDVRAIGEVRTKPGGEPRNAFCLLDGWQGPGRSAG